MCVNTVSQYVCMYVCLHGEPVRTCVYVCQHGEPVRVYVYVCTALLAGTECQYVMGKVECPKDSITRIA